MIFNVLLFAGGNDYWSKNKFQMAFAVALTFHFKKYQPYKSFL